MKSLQSHDLEKMTSYDAIIKCLSSKHRPCQFKRDVLDVEEAVATAAEPNLFTTSSV